MAENKLSSPKSVLILIFVILFTVVAALSVVAFLTSVEKSSPVAVQPTVTPTLVPTIVVSDWKTYRNEKYGFELTFPDNWEGYKVNNKSDLIEFSLKRKNPEVINDIKIEDYGVIFAIKSYSKDEWKRIFESSTKPQLIYAGENENYIFGYIRYLKTPEEEELFEVYNPSYEVNTKIIPTFKFTGKELSDGWESYKSEKYGYEIKYPEGLLSLNSDMLKDGIREEYSVFNKISSYGELNNDPYTPYPFFNGMGINIPDKINGVSVKSINNLDDLKNELNTEYDKMSLVSYDFEEITFKNGISVIRLNGAARRQNFYVYYIKSNNRIARIVVKPFKESLDQYEKIISTFKFL